MQIDPIPDSPKLPPLPSGPTPSRTVDGYAMLPFLPIITSPAARLRAILGERMTEAAIILTQLDTVRTQIAEVDRQIMALEALKEMRAAADEKVDKRVERDSH